MDQMDRFDEELRARAKKEPFPLPEDYAGRVFRTCAALEETDMSMSNKSKTKRAARYGGWIAAALALFMDRLHRRFKNERAVRRRFEL